MKTTLIGLSVAATLLALTNQTSKEAYADYLIQTWQSQVCTQRSLPPVQETVCKVGGIVPNSLKSYIAQNYVMEKNHVFFTIYYFNMGSVQNRTLGIGGQFFNI